jgi:hypothetical protein
VYARLLLEILRNIRGRDYVPVQEKEVVPIGKLPDQVFKQLFHIKSNQIRSMKTNEAQKVCMDFDYAYRNFFDALGCLPTG